MIALRVVFRMGWALPNPATAMNSDRLLVPFAYLEPSTAKTTYKATVTVKDSQEEAAAISGALVDLNGSRKRTNASGVAEFQLFDGTYPVKVKASGFKPASGTVTVKGAAATLDFNLVEA